MEFILPAWEDFRRNNDPREDSVKSTDMNINTMTDSQRKDFKERLLVFIKLLQEVLERLDKTCNSPSGDPSTTTQVLVTDKKSTMKCDEGADNWEKAVTIKSEVTSPTSQEKMEVCDQGSDQPDEENDARPIIPIVDPNLVQIKASKSEIDRRITAFIERKQQEVDEMNKREFCSVFSLASDGQSEETCARTDAVFIPRAGSRSHVKVSRVVNVQGPQTNPGYTGNSPGRSRPVEVHPDPLDSTPVMEERVTNIEQHLNLEQDPRSSKDMFSRLKGLESRILYLESISPEYFTHGPPPPKKKKRYDGGMMQPKLKLGEITPKHKDLTIDEIDMKMKALKDKLLSENS